MSAQTQRVFSHAHIVEHDGALFPARLGEPIEIGIGIAISVTADSVKDGGNEGLRSPDAV